MLSLKTMGCIALLFVASVVPAASATPSRVRPRGQTIGGGSVEPQAVADLIRIAPNLWNGPLPAYETLRKTDDNVNMRLMITFLLFAIAFRRIHPTADEQGATLMGIVGAFLQKGWLPTHDDVEGYFNLAQGSMEMIKSISARKLRKYLKGMRLDSATTARVNAYLQDYKDNDLAMDAVFPVFAGVVNPWNDPNDGNNNGNNAENEGVDG